MRPFSFPINRMSAEARAGTAPEAAGLNTPDTSPLSQAQHEVLFHRGMAALIADSTGATAILIPGLAYGEDGRRLGRGAGWYDRALTAAGKGSLVIGGAVDSDVVPGGTIPVEDQDHNVGFSIKP